MSNLINELHQELVSLQTSRTLLVAKYDPGFGLHKTKLGTAQKDKARWHDLTSKINAFETTLRHYGYAVGGPDHTLYKETV